MSRQRKLIRQAAAAVLKNNTSVGDKVFPSRPPSLSEGSGLPAIFIYGDAEAISLHCESPREYRRELELKIDVTAAGAAADDELDDIGDRVERLIGRSDRLTYQREPTVAEISLAGARVSYRQEGTQMIGSLVITYSAVYYTGEPDAEDPEPLDDLKAVATDYSLENRQAPADRAADLVTGLNT
jgi:hypothetical protein